MYRRNVIFCRADYVENILVFLRSDLDNIEKEIQNVESQLESHQNDLIGPQTDREVASKILPDIILLDQRYQEIQVLKCDVENLKSKLPSTGKLTTILIS